MVNSHSRPEDLAKINPRPDNWDEIFSKPTREEYTEFIVGLVEKNNLVGSVVECGVGRGKSLMCFAELLPSETLIWGFDSFQGLPEPASIDKHGKKVKRGYITHDYKKVSETFKGYKNVKLKKGFFEKSLRKYNDDPIAVLHLDCDLYASYKTCLEQLYDLVIPGGIIMFDEYWREYWAYSKWAGAPLAIDEFFKGKVFNPQHYPSFGGKTYMIKEQ